MFENVTVLARSNNKTDRALLEALQSKQHNPVFNKQVKELTLILKYFN